MPQFSHSVILTEFGYVTANRPFIHNVNASVGIPNLLTVPCSSCDQQDPDSAASGRPESVIGNKLWSLLFWWFPRPTRPSMSQRGSSPSLVRLDGMEVATKISSAGTMAPAPMITN